MALDILAGAQGFSIQAMAAILVKNSLFPPALSDLERMNPHLISELMKQGARSILLQSFRPAFGLAIVQSLNDFFRYHTRDSDSSFTRFI